MNSSSINRFYSEPVDVHKWSNHPEIKLLTDKLYLELNLKELESRSNNKRGAKPKHMLRVLLLDLYVRWIKDPQLSSGFRKSDRAYRTGSRYKKLYIGRKIIDVESALETYGYLDTLPHYYSSTGAGRSFSTRIRPSEKLQNIFKQLTVELYDIDFHHMAESVILREKFYDEDNRGTTNVDIEYQDNDYTEVIRKQLDDYNELLKYTFIDIPSFTSSVFTREITKGPRAGERTTISLGPDNKFARRVFSGGLESDWKLNGRFYGGWWQQVDKEYRREIYINDEPTYEFDLKAIHPNILSNRDNIELPEDPYNLDEYVLGKVGKLIQRKYVKLLVLMAINAKNPKDAYAAFRDSDRTDKLASSLTNKELEQLLTAFCKEYPHMEKYLCKGLGLELMGEDGKIANLVIDHFTKKHIPVLCIHDSFIINHKLGEELTRTVANSTHQITGYRIRQDIKNERLTTTLKVVGNIEGFGEPVNLNLNRPIKIEPTKEYLQRRDKFMNWIKLSRSK